jgi:hypothetical protein
MNNMQMKEKCQKFLRDWMNGESKHIDEYGLCIPDHSCCIPELQQPEAVRKAVFDAFLIGDQERICNFFLVFEEALRQKAISITGEPKIFVNNQNGRISFYDQK